MSLLAPLLAITAYILLVQTLRFRRSQSALRKYAYTDRASLSRMTYADAQAVVRELAVHEFPTMFELGVQLALFKTYCFESISRLLTATRQLGTAENAAKRYEDTSILFGECVC